MDLIDEPESTSNAPEFSVSEISGAVKKTLEGAFGRVRVRGEVGRVVRARSGHLYYDIKDDRNVLSCTTWKGQAARLTVQPEEGMEVIVTGKLTAYGAQSRYNMNVDDVEVAGEGALLAMLEKRKAALAAEGLFAQERKKDLPYLPDVIGVITSPTGAVIRDILHRLRDRFPRKVLVWPVAVQGANCAPEVSAAIHGFSEMSAGGALPRPDLIIVARGGGSTEDLWGFNEEIVARAIADCTIPLISAVGHETDTTLIDFVSDMRAPTPTAAAELAVPVRLELLAWVREQDSRLSRALSQGVMTRKQRLGDLSRALPNAENLTNTAQQRLDFLAEKLPTALREQVNKRRQDTLRVAGALRPSLLRQKLKEDGRRLADMGRQHASSLERHFERAGDAYRRQSQGLRTKSLRDDVRRHRDNLTRLSQSLSDIANRQHAERTSQIVSLDRLRTTLGYEATLHRGYAVVRADGELATQRADAAGAASIEIQFSDGRITFGNKPAKPKQDMTPPEQGSLL